MDHVRHAMTADRLDRHIDVFQSKPVRRNFFQRETFRCDLLQRKFLIPRQLLGFQDRYIKPLCHDKSVTELGVA